MLHVQGITRRFGPQTVFENLSWHIGPGQRIGLVGPNGAGKTTLLKILAGVEAPDSGEVTSAKGTLIGYLPQEVETLQGSTVLGQVLSGFSEVREIEEEIERIEILLSTRLSPEEMDRATRRYGDLRHRFEALGGYRLEGEAMAILGGLGFAQNAMHAPLETLSGGWRMRAALAGHLLRRPDLLLLDEPTNHLDLESLAWLEEFLEDYDGSIVIVSHDRFFLNRVVGGVAELEGARLSLYAGDYDDYLEDKQARTEALLAAKKAQDRQIAETERFIERFRYKATKARQVQSRIKRLDKVERIRLHRGPKSIHFAFPQPPRSGAETIRAIAIHKRFGETVVYRGIDFIARRGERIALVGPNGAGKSTLLKILAGVIPADQGARTLGHNVTLHYYAQHQLEALGAGRTVFEEIETVAPDALRPKIRSLLGAFLFSGDDVDKKVGVLSGGEKARLALAKMLVRPASLLLLDEPTNHLDLRARGILEEALDQYTGTIVFISHDRYFINRIATSVCMVGAGALEVWPGSYDDFMEHLRERQGPAAPERRASAAPGPARSSDAAPQARAPKSAGGASGSGGPGGGTKPASGSGSGKTVGPSRGRAEASPSGGEGPERGRTGRTGSAARAPAGEAEVRGFRWEDVDEDEDGDRQRPVPEPPAAATAGPKTREQKRREAEERDRLHRETRGFKERLAAVEKEIASLEVRLKEVEVALSDPGLYKDGEKTRDVNRQHKEIQERIAWLYDEWAHLEEAISSLGAGDRGPSA